MKSQIKEHPLHVISPNTLSIWRDFLSFLLYPRKRSPSHNRIFIRDIPRFPFLFLCIYHISDTNHIFPSLFLVLHLRQSAFPSFVNHCSVSLPDDAFLVNTTIPACFPISFSFANPQFLIQTNILRRNFGFHSSNFPSLLFLHIVRLYFLLYHAKTVRTISKDRKKALFSRKIVISRKIEIF